MQNNFQIKVLFGKDIDLDFVFDMENEEKFRCVFKGGKNKKKFSIQG